MKEFSLNKRLPKIFKDPVLVPQDDQLRQIVAEALQLPCFAEWEPTSGNVIELSRAIQQSMQKNGVKLSKIHTYHGPKENE